MKKFLSSLALLTVLAVMPASAQFSFGLKGGLNLSSMSFSESVLDDAVKDHAGWFIGPTAKFSLPVLPLSFDIAALYDQKEAKVVDETVKQQNILIPINARFSFGLSSLTAVYVAAGPQFGFNVGDKKFAADTFKLDNSSLSLNLGAGVTALKHLEVGFAYNIALGNTGEFAVLDAAGKAIGSITSKTNAWTISAAYYF